MTRNGILLPSPAWSNFGQSNPITDQDYLLICPLGTSIQGQVSLVNWQRTRRTLIHKHSNALTEKD
jgi:hypothetical protein